MNKLQRTIFNDPRLRMELGRADWGSLVSMKNINKCTRKEQTAQSFEVAKNAIKNLKRTSTGCWWHHALSDYIAWQTFVFPFLLAPENGLCNNVSWLGLNYIP